MRTINEFNMNEIMELMGKTKPISVITNEKLLEIEEQNNMKKGLASFCFAFFNMLFEANETIFQKALLSNKKIDYSLIKEIMKSRNFRKELKDIYECFCSYFIDNVINNNSVNIPMDCGYSISRIIAAISIAYTTIMNRSNAIGCSGEGIYRAISYDNILRYNAFIKSIG